MWDIKNEKVQDGKKTKEEVLLFQEIKALSH